MIRIPDEERKRRGRLAEDAVCEAMIAAGFIIRDRNLRISNFGELDIVAWRKGILTVVEVKARQQDDRYGGPLSAITPAKLSRIRKTTLAYMKRNDLLNNDVRFLAAGVSLSNTGEISSIKFVPVEWL